MKRRERAAYGLRAAGRTLAVALALVLLTPPRTHAADYDPAAHTDPINLTPEVRAAAERFYDMDYDGALGRYEAILRAHPDDPMAVDYVQKTLIIRELYRQDLLDTTYYAHDSFLTSKRRVDISQQTRDRIEALTSQAIALCDREIKANPADKNAYFARGYARGMHAVFITLADHSFVAAARQGLASRNDSEQVLKLDPGYDDARMAIGIQQFAVASLPRFLRFMVGIAGIGGSKERGLKMLREAAAHGVVTPVEAKTALALFLRHDARYPEAIAVERGLVAEYPRNYLFRLELANLTKDIGNGPAAIALYKEVIAYGHRPGYFVEPRLHMAYFGLADTERGQNQLQAAAEDYLNAAAQPGCSEWIRRRAQLNAGEVFDLLHDRPQAVRQYQLAAAGGGDQSQADAARRYLKTPYTGK